MSRVRAQILLVDDNEDMRDLQATFLRLRGWDVVVARGASEALRVLADGLRPSLILLDFHLPGMNGRDFREAQRAQGLAIDVPVVLYSADPAVTDDGIDADAVLIFPVELNDLAVTIDELLARS